MLFTFILMVLSCFLIKYKIKKKERKQAIPCPNQQFYTLDTREGRKRTAVLAQLVERMAFNHVVVGSIPTDGESGCILA